MRQYQFIMALGGTLSLMFCLDAAAQDAGPVQYAIPQEGRHGVGHDRWHRDFYSKLKRKDGSSCCDHMDCRPTQSRMIDDHYEVKVDDEWVPVAKDKIINVVAPDGGAHVCAPEQLEGYKGVKRRDLLAAPGGLARGRGVRLKARLRTCGHGAQDELRCLIAITD